MGTPALPIYSPAQGNIGNKGGLTSTAGSLYNTNAGLANTTNAQRTSEGSTLSGGYNSLLNSGYSDAEKSGINQSTLGAINSSYGAANDAASRRMGATGNSAGYGSFLGANARNRASDLASQNLKNQSNFADVAYQRKLAGLQGLQQMYGVDTSFLNSLGQQQLGALGIGNSVQSRSKGKLNTVQQILGMAGL